MSLVELGKGHCQAVYHGFIVTKHVCLFTDGDTKVAECVAEVNRTFHTCAGSNKFRTVSRRFNSSLLLTVPINRGLVDKIENSSDRSPRKLAVE